MPRVDQHAASNIPLCRHAHCDAPVHANHFCAVHEQQRQLRAGDAREATALLHTGATLDAQPLQHTRLRTELRKLQQWWDRAIDVQRTGCDLSTLPVEEHRTVLETCRARARPLIMADRGQLPARLLGLSGRPVWQLFANLEKGLYSDGRPRPRPI